MLVKNFARPGRLPTADCWCKMCNFVFGRSRYSYSLKISKYVKIINIVKIVKGVLHGAPVASGTRHMSSVESVRTVTRPVLHGCREFDEIRKKTQKVTLSSF